jgi:hypothetical protein
VRYRSNNHYDTIDLSVITRNPSLFVCVCGRSLDKFHSVGIVGVVEFHIVDERGGWGDAAFGGVAWWQGGGARGRERITQTNIKGSQVVVTWRD